MRYYLLPIERCALYGGVLLLGVIAGAALVDRARPANSVYLQTLAPELADPYRGIGVFDDPLWVKDEERFRQTFMPYLPGTAPVPAVAISTSIEHPVKELAPVTLEVPAEEEIADVGPKQEVKSAPRARQRVRYRRHRRKKDD